jgi:hypothetical protein
MIWDAVVASYRRDQVIMTVTSVNQSEYVKVRA